VTTSPEKHRACVVLFSGGLDSTTLLALVAHNEWRVHALTVRYGQRHTNETEAARRIARSYGVAAHEIVDIDLRAFGGSALTDDIAVPRNRSDAEIGAGIPVTYVPARNTVFLSLALAWAETVGAFDLFIGVNAIDYSGYPDCRPDYIHAFEAMANLGTKAGVEGTARFRVHTPLIDMSKRQIIELGTKLGVDFGATWSCYDPAADGAACGECDACRLRRKGFADAAMTDPLRYAGHVR
jgi:7-cyano-7-deazaguanine synthase